MSTETIQTIPRVGSAGRPELPKDEKKRRVQLYINPALAEFLEAEDERTKELPAEDRAKIARRRKQEAAKLLLDANIQSRIL